jgi:hypothetical protein
MVSMWQHEVIRPSGLDVLLVQLLDVLAVCMEQVQVLNVEVVLIHIVLNLPKVTGFSI